MIKYVFLDIDGVISTYDESMYSTKDYWIEHPWAKRLNIMHGFNTECVKIYNEIILETGCKTILSSDWKRHGRTLSDLDEIFKQNGVVESPIDVTPDYRDNYSNLEYGRSIEIIHYIAENHINVDDIVILDDLNLEMLFPPKVKNRFIKTHFEYGIKEEGFKDLIINMLK